MRVVQTTKPAPYASRLRWLQCYRLCQTAVCRVDHWGLLRACTCHMLPQTSVLKGPSQLLYKCPGHKEPFLDQGLSTCRNPSLLHCMSALCTAVPVLRSQSRLCSQVCLKTSTTRVHRSIQHTTCRLQKEQRISIDSKWHSGKGWSQPFSLTYFLNSLPETGCCFWHCI